MRNADYLCELLSPIDPQEAAGYLADDRYLVQLKANGDRLIVERYADRLFAFDREGKITALPTELAANLELLGEDFMVDGERIGYGDKAQFVVWDLLRWDDEDIKHWPYAERFAKLAEIVGVYRRLCLGEGSEFRGKTDSLAITLIYTWGLEGWSAPNGLFSNSLRQLAAPGFYETEKKSALLAAYENGAEGVCFKDKLAVFQNGRAGQHYKLKFWESCTCRVADKSQRADARLDKRSVALEMWGETEEEARWFPMGFATIPASTPMPALGSYVEIRYLYGEAGGLYQPVFLGQRTDVNAGDCNLDQVKWYRSHQEVTSAMERMIYESARNRQPQP